jgi:hypothetical protein
MLRVLFFWQRAELARQSGQKNKTAPLKAGHGFLCNTKRSGSAQPIQLPQIAMKSGEANPVYIHENTVSTACQL